MELVGLLIFASLFIFSGWNHIKNHITMAAYTETSMGKCPLSKQLGYLGGWPTGLFLVTFGAGTVINRWSLFPYGLAAFLALMIVLFHRNLKDPANAKTLALLGSALYIASQVK